VERSQVIDASPQRVWALLSSPEAWALRPAAFAFDIRPSTGERLRITLGLARAGPYCVLYEITGEVPGQTISLQAKGPRSLGREQLTLSAVAQDGGTKTTITARNQLVHRASKASVKAFWEVQLQIWLENLSAVSQGPEPIAGRGDGTRPAGGAVGRPVVPLAGSAFGVGHGECTG
jgi:uncharacterized protein YndB with AHSA1/START domain